MWGGCFSSVGSLADKGIGSGTQHSMGFRSPSPRPKVLPHSNRVVPSPGTVVAQVGRTEILVASPQPVKLEMLGHAKFETLGDINAHTPRVLDADGVGRPGVKGLGYGLAK